MLKQNLVKQEPVAAAGSKSRGTNVPVQTHVHVCPRHRGKVHLSQYRNAKKHL